MYSRYGRQPIQLTILLQIVYLPDTQVLKVPVNTLTFFRNVRNRPWRGAYSKHMLGAKPIRTEEL
jgi:hypothetical protein